MTSYDPEERPPVVPTPPTTGVSAVDHVLEGLEGLEARPVASRVAGFEDAHTALRRALDTPDEDDDGGQGSQASTTTGAGSTDGPGAQPDRA